jgi:hypothetical protein
VIDYVVVRRRRLREYMDQVEGLDMRFVVLHPGKVQAIEWDASRAKSQEHASIHGLPIGEHFAYLEEVLLDELSGIGLWIDNGGLTPEKTVGLIRAEAEAARLW